MLEEGLNLYVVGKNQPKNQPEATHYAILGVARVATQKEVREAYRALAKVWHPDLHPGNAKALAAMKLINEAWSCLSNVEKRAEYDEILARFGRAGSNEYARKRYEQHVGIWSRGSVEESETQTAQSRTREEGGPRYDAFGRKIPDFIHVDGPRAVFHGKPFRERNQQSFSSSRRSVVMMGGQDKKVREPKPRN